MRDLCVAVMCAGVAAGVRAENLGSASLQLQPPDGGALTPAPVDAPPVYGQPGAWWWTVGGGGGASINNGEFSAAAFAGASTFFAEDFEIVLDLTVWYLADESDGNDSAAFNLNPKFRWHFLHEENYTLFAELGVGLAIATDETPDGGSEFNFTPQAGVGATIPLGDGPERLVTGINWRHFSNANTFGADRNPGRDDLFVYVGVTFPF